MRTKGIMQTKKDERREKILTEAYRIFVEKKIEPVSMGEIAEAAGIGTAGILVVLYPMKQTKTQYKKHLKKQGLPMMRLFAKTFPNMQTL
ncbi:MAG: hypothetical protein BHV87_12115 [Clostridiales bacterium 36_14]|nr:MAG: hypothetical protein BHV87_12115 [Clostridiales bacterium 36_14]